VARQFREYCEQESLKWQREAEERTRIEEERQEGRRHRAAHHRWLCHEWYRLGGPNLAGDNHPPWWSPPAVELVHSPFRNSPLILAPFPRYQEEREIFHREGCTCPISFPVPCFPDPSRRTENDIYEEVNKEFTRRFEAAKLVTTHCRESQALWQVLHYCRYTEKGIQNPHFPHGSRTRGGRWVGQLLHHEVYAHLAHDTLRFIEPGTKGFFRQCALRIIPRIIEHCVYRSGQIGPGGPARPQPGSWGYPIATNNTVLAYLLHHDNPGARRLNFKIFKFAKGGSNPSAAYCEASPLPEACVCLTRFNPDATVPLCHPRCPDFIDLLQ
jgi:hypothetical protein